MSNYLDVCTAIALGLLALAFGCTAWRFVRGPSVFDRILAFDVFAVTGVALLVLLSLRWETDEYLELVLVYTVLGFSSTAAFTVYLIRSDAAEKEVAGDEPTDTDAT